MNNIIPISKAGYGLVDPIVPRTEIARVAVLPDPVTKVVGIAERKFSAANFDSWVDISQLPVRQKEARAAQRHYDKRYAQRKGTDDGYTKTVSTASPAQKLVYTGLLCIAGIASFSACFQTAQWIIQAEILPTGGLGGALLMTGVVASGFIAIPLAWYAQLVTDAARRLFHRGVMGVSALSVATWLAAFMLAAWSQDKIDFETLHGARGSLYSLADLSGFSAIAKAIMVPAGVIGECFASAAIKIGISIAKDRGAKKEFVPSAHRAALDQRVLEAEAVLVAKLAEVHRLLGLKTAFEAGLRDFVHTCMAEIFLHKEGLDAHETVSRAKYINGEN